MKFYALYDDLEMNLASAVFSLWSLFHVVWCCCVDRIFYYRRLHDDDDFQLVFWIACWLPVGMARCEMWLRCRSKNRKKMFGETRRVHRKAINWRTLIFKSDVKNSNIKSKCKDFLLALIAPPSSALRLETLLKLFCRAALDTSHQRESSSSCERTWNDIKTNNERRKKCFEMLLLKTKIEKNFGGDTFHILWDEKWKEREKTSEEIERSSTFEKVICV